MSKEQAYIDGKAHVFFGSYAAATSHAQCKGDTETRQEAIARAQTGPVLAYL